MNARPQDLQRQAQHESEPYKLRQFTFPGLEGLSRKSMEVHLELYAGYVKEANAISTALADPRAYAKVANAVHARESLARRLSFEVSGVRLHELFFEQLNPARTTPRPRLDGALTHCFIESFGGFNEWVEDINTLGTIRGPGWVLTCWDRTAQRLDNVWVDLHQLALPADQNIVFALDLWEHAYWDDFGAKGRADYIEQVLRQTDWGIVEARILPATI